MSTRKTAIVVGVLFFTQTLSFLIGDGLITSALQAPDLLENLNADQVRIGVVLLFINCAAIICLGVVIFPILRRYREVLALGYTGFKIVESLMLLVSALSPLVLLGVSQAHGAGDPSQLQALGTLATQWYDMSFQLGMIGLGIGGIMLCYTLYKAKLVPSIIAVVGLVGYVALIANGWLMVFGVDAGSLLFAPGAVFEFTFPLWLIVKGFNESAVAARA